MYNLLFQNFTTVLSSPHLWVTKLAIQIKPIEPVLEAGAQIQQLAIIECVEEYTGIFKIINKYNIPNIILFCLTNYIINFMIYVL